MKSNRIRSLMVGERGFEPPTPWSRTRFGDPAFAINHLEDPSSKLNTRAEGKWKRDLSSSFGKGNT